MAEKKEEKREPEKKEGEKHEGGAKKHKKHLHQIVTTFAHDGTATHEHVYKAKKEDHHTEPPVLAGTSSNMEDLHDHMDDHAGPMMNQGGGEEEEPQGGEPGGGEEEPPQE